MKRGQYFALVLLGIRMIDVCSLVIHTVRMARRIVTINANQSNTMVTERIRRRRSEGLMTERRKTEDYDCVYWYYYGNWYWY